MLTVNPSFLSGDLYIPPSKSHTMRAILFGSMAKGKTIISHYLKSPDVFAMIEAMRNFGVEIEIEEEKLFIWGVDKNLQKGKDVIDAGNSGQVLRFVGAFASLLPTYTVITGDDSIRNLRPITPLIQGIRQLGGFASGLNLDDKAPLIIKGPIQSGTLKVEGRDSQPISALIMATSFLEGETTLFVEDPGEKPWIDLTLSWIEKLGGKVSHRDYKEFQISGGLSYEGFDCTIPSDFSSLAFPLAAAIITGSTLTFHNVDMQDVQGDKKIIDLFQEMGAQIKIEKNRLTVFSSSDLRGVKVDVNDMIDALPIIAVVACFAKGTTEISNAKIARRKESDRIYAITTELKKMGACIEEKEDGLCITGSRLSGSSLKSYSDHRIGMALAIGALGATCPSTIDDSRCMQKSYPSFVSDMQKVGALFCV